VRSLNLPLYYRFGNTRIQSGVPISCLYSSRAVYFSRQMPLSRKPNARPLPPCPESFPVGSDLWDAFQICKSLEPREQWLLYHGELAHPRSENVLLDLTPACAGRVLGFALLYSPSRGGRDALAAEIIGCNGDDELLAGLAHLYVYGLIRVCTFRLPPACSLANARQFIIQRWRHPTFRLSKARESLSNKPPPNSNTF